MLTDLSSFFADRMTPPEIQGSGLGERHEVCFAAAALLIVCARADFEEHPEEQSTIFNLLETTFDLDEESLHELLDLVDPDAAVTGLQEFTNLVNQHYSAQDKRVLIENLWRVALADGRLDRFEEQYIARVAFMTGVSGDEVSSAQARVTSSGTPE